jgi:hypothetical protein
MVTETLLIFLTSVMSLNQPANVNQQVKTTQYSQTKEVVESKNEPASNLLRGGWDRN